MKPMTLILAFAWIAILGLSFTILRDFFGSILVAAAVFTLLACLSGSRNGST